MPYDNEPPEALPVRGRTRQAGGRHRRPASAELPADAPALILVIAGEAPEVGAEIAAQSRAVLSELDIRVATPSTLPGALTGLADGRPPIVVPLVTGPHPELYRAIDAALAAAGVRGEVTEPLGPHPLLAEALHVRLAESGLARADRIRQFSIGSPVDGVVIATAGGPEAVMEAEVSSVLLAARLALPVVVASVDGAPALADAIAHVRTTGAARIAVAPYLIGPEMSADDLAKLTADAGVSCAAPLGAHSAVVQLVHLRYEAALGEDQP